MPQQQAIELIALTKSKSMSEDDRMKPEPLKNKIWYVDEINSEQSGIFNTPIIPKKDVASAVEWLKDKMFRHLIDGSMETRDNISTYDAHELIDEAFEDVVKKK